MLSVFICEDNPIHLEQITKCVSDHIIMENLGMKIACSTTSPKDIINYLCNNKVAGLYFLDVDLNCETDGIALAEAIRKYDPRGFIVFITADAESLQLTFEYKVEPMDYILKEGVTQEPRIRKCIDNAYIKYTAMPSPLQNNFVFKQNRDSVAISVPCSDIVYFEICPDVQRRINLYTGNSRHSFRGELTKIEKHLDHNFVRCHRAYIVNLTKIVKIDDRNLILHLNNGDSIYVAAKHLKKIMG